MNTWSHGVCTVNGNDITYTPDENYEWNDSCEIQVKDDEWSGKNIIIYWWWIDTKKPTCEINYISACTSGDVTLNMNTIWATQYSWTWFDNMSWNNHGFVVEYNWRYTWYVKDAAWNTWSCSRSVNNISTWVLSAPNNLRPESGTITWVNTPILSWNNVSNNWCREVSGYEYQICRDSDCAEEISSGTVNWTSVTTDSLFDWNYYWRVRTKDTMWWKSEWSEMNLLIIKTSWVSCSIKIKNSECTHENVDLEMTVTWTYYSWIWIGTTWFSNSLVVSENWKYTWYVWDEVWHTWSCSIEVNTIDTWSLSAPTWLQPESGNVFNYTPSLSWNAVDTWEGCLDVVKYEVVVQNTEGIVASGIVSGSITTWNPGSLNEWTYYWYVKVYDNINWFREDAYQSDTSSFKIDTTKPDCALTVAEDSQSCTSGNLILNLKRNSEDISWYNFDWRDVFENWRW